MTEISLAAAMEYVQANAREGVTCPCCGQMAKIYARRIHRTPARTLAQMYALAGTDRAVHVASEISPGTEVEKLRYWGLVEPQGPDRDGYWRVTEVGERFLSGQLVLPMYALVYDSRFLGLEGDPVVFADCVGEPFDFQALMSA